MDDILECPICKEILEQVVETPCCHKCYCSECIKAWTTKKGDCPECRSPINFVDCKPNFPIQRMINNLPTQCPYKEKGCNDKVTKGTLKEHILKCDYATISCPFLPSECLDTFFRKDKGKHEQECKFRPVNCPKCEAEGIRFDQLQQHLDTTCPGSDITCPDCKLTLARKDLQAHHEMCAQRPQKCRYAKYGCTFVAPGDKQEEHEQASMGDHLALTVKAVETRDEENGLLLKKIDSLQLDLIKYKEITSSMKPDLPFSPLNMFPVILPSILVLHSPSMYINMESDHVVTYKGGALFGSWKPATTTAVSVRGDVLIPKADGIYYFEMLIESSGKDGAIGIGLSAFNHDMLGMPGWSKGYGYHGDDGRIFSQDTGGTGKEFGPTYTKDDTIGMGWDMRNKTIFFTKNDKNLGVAFQNVEGKYYPVVGLHTPGAKVRVNFGKQPFKYKL